MSNLNVDFSAVRNEKNELVKVRNNLDDVFNYIGSNTKLLREYWETKTSREVFESFESFCEYLESIRSNFDADINFINKHALGTYETANVDLTKQVTDHLEVRG